jgi:Predicted dithiol-disulfide isomerase involved in polyketide biosynthesis
MNKYESFHENIFHAYFTDGLDIGSLDVISSAAKKSGLDADDLLDVIKDERYKPRLASARKEGRLINLTGVPTFIINDKHRIVGAQQIDVFRDLFNNFRVDK